MVVTNSALVRDVFEMRDAVDARRYRRPMHRLRQGAWLGDERTATPFHRSRAGSRAIRSRVMPGDTVHGPNGEWGVIFRRLDGRLRVAWVTGHITDVPHPGDAAADNDHP